MKFDDRKCSCGSGKMYKDCCAIKKNLSIEVLIDKNFGPSLLKKMKNYSMLCVFQDLKGKVCNEKSIKSHTIQNNRFLSVIAEDNMVYHVVPNISESNPFAEKALQSVKVASIFKCLCSYHDNEIFKDIELNEFVNSSKQFFLFAFRAVCFTYWKTKADYEINKKYIYDIYNVQKAIIEIPGFLEMYVSKVDDSERAKTTFNEFNKILNKKYFNDLNNYVIEINYKIGVSCCIDTNLFYDLNGEILYKKSDKLHKKNIYPSIYISVFTDNNKSYIILSWQQKYNFYNKNFIKQLKKLSINDQLNVFNILLPILSEDIYYSPKIFKDWSNNQYTSFYKNSSAQALISYQKYGINLYNYINKSKYNLFKKID